MESKTALGMLTVDELRTLVESGEIDTVVVAICDMQGRLMGKRVTGRFFLDHAVNHGTHFCVYLLGTDMDMNTPDGFPDMSWEQGYGDWVARPDLATLRRIPWLNRTAMVLADVVTESGALVDVAPRNILQHQVERAKQLGFAVKMASELEFYLMRQTYEQLSELNYSNIELAGHYNEDYNLLQGTRNEFLYQQFRTLLSEAGIPIECTKGEAGVAQHEINVYYADAMQAADRHVLLKQGMKEISIQHNSAVTFMAKPFHEWTGSSSHIHVSLWSEDGRSAFYDPGSSMRGVSDTMAHFLAGVMAHMRELAILFAPNVNSYKRYAKASWAPTNIVWGWDNRTTGLRIVGHGQSLRIEDRFPGADTNPYLAFAALIASGLDGIERKLPLAPAFNGNGYQANPDSRLPSSLQEAIDAFAHSDFARHAFGERVYQHYLNAAWVELNAFQQIVTDWERRRYFERA